MDPISGGLAGLALVQKSVEFIKSNINTVNDIRDIASTIDSAFAGEKQIQKERFGTKSVIGQHRDAATAVIDAKLAQEQLHELSILIDNRFGFGTWRQIINERAKRIADEKEAVRAAKAKKKKEREQFQETLKILTISVGGALIVAFVLILVIVT